MTFLVAFDGLDLSAAALARAHELAEQLDEKVVAVIVVPEDPLHALEYGWIEDESEFDPEAIAETLRKRAEDVAPDAAIRVESVHAYAAHGTIAQRISDAAIEIGADVVFVGSDNAGRVTGPVTSVGDRIAEGTEYDVYIVRGA